MKTSKQRESKNLSDFEKFILNNSKIIVGGLGDTGDDGGPIDPPTKPGMPSNDRPF